MTVLPQQSEKERVTILDVTCSFVSIYFFARSISTEPEICSFGKCVITFVDIGLFGAYSSSSTVVLRRILGTRKFYHAKN